VVREVQAKAEKVRSPLIWIGGKSRLAKHIISLMPRHRCYVELFGGAAHVLVQKPPVECEVYNDIDGRLVNFMLVAREDAERLIQACDTLPYSRELYERWIWEEWPDDPFELAVRFFYLNRSAIVKGNSGYKSGWRHSKDTNTARAYYNAIQFIRVFAERMKNVMIEHRDFRDVIRVYDGPDTLFYVDPPYFGCEHYYAGDFGEKDHRDLADMLNHLQGKAILSYYDHPLLSEFYPDWRVQRIQATKQTVVSGSVSAEELLLMNFEEGQICLDI
jgi:DNA adenine methylase